MYVCIYISIYVWLAVCVFVCVCVRVCVRVRVRVCVRAGYGPTIGHGYHSDGQTLACRRMHCESRPELNQNSAEQLGGVRREYSNEKMSRTQAEAARAQRSLSAPPVRIGAVLSQSDQVRCSSVGPSFSENKFCLRKTFRARSGEAPRVRVDSDARGTNCD